MEKAKGIIKDLLENSQQITESFERLDSLNISEFGLDISSIENLIEIVLDPTYPISHSLKKHIIKNYLYFKHPLPDSLILDIVSSLGFPKFKGQRRKVSYIIQGFICDWLIDILPFVANKSIFTRIYGNLLAHFEFDFLRPRIFSLLALTATPNVITKTRITKVFDIFTKFSNDRYASSLLAIFKRIKPNDVLDNFTSYVEIQEPNREYVNKLTLLLETSKKIHHAEENIYLERERKRKMLKLPSKESLDQHKALYDIFMLANDESKLFQYIISSSKQDIQELDKWLYLTLLGTDTVSQVFLQNMVNYILRTGHFPQCFFDNVVSKRLSEDETLDDDPVWRLVPRITDPIFIEKLTNIYLENSKSKKMHWNIKFLDSILNSITNTITETNSTEISCCIKNIISKFIIRLEVFNYHTEYIHTILNFMTKIIKVSVILPTDVLIFPPILFYSLFLHSDALVISKLCDYINICKEVLKQRQHETKIFTDLHNSYVIDMINLIWRDKAFVSNKNAIHPDIVFGISPELISDLNIKVPLSNLSLDIKAIFSIFHSPAFALLSSNVIKNLENSHSDCTLRLEGPFTPKSFAELTHNESKEKWIDLSYEEVKLKILENLDNLGLTGIKEFLFSHLKSLGTLTSEGSTS